MSQSFLSEDQLVEAIRSIVEDPPGGRVLLGIGDDAAVWQPSRSNRSLITTDALVENVHFTRETMDLREVGWRAMVANLNDIAAMGGKPVLATVAIGLPDPGLLDEVLELYRGLQEASAKDGCSIAGGDISRAPVLTIAITIVGEVRPSNLKMRSGARAGDAIAVTGELGAARAGLDVAREAVSLEGEDREQALRAHRRPPSRVREGRWLTTSANAHAMMDISDGLSTDLLRMCARSNVGAIVENVPIAPSAYAAARALGEDPQSYALAGGEDYELLVAVAPRALRHIATRYRARFGRELYRVGSFTSEPEVVVRTSAGERPLLATGWDHIRP